MSPVGPIGIYPSAPRNTDPRAVPSPARAQRLRRRRADRSNRPRAGPPCPNYASAEGKAWCPRSVPSRSTHPRRETPIRAPFLRPRALNVFAAGALTAATVPAPARPVRTTHRPRGRLGFPGRSHRDLPIRAERHRSARRFFARERPTSWHWQQPACGGRAARALPVRTTPRPRGRLGVPCLTHRDVSIKMLSLYKLISTGTASRSPASEPPRSPSGPGTAAGTAGASSSSIRSSESTRGSLPPPVGYVGIRSHY